MPPNLKTFLVKLHQDLGQYELWASRHGTDEPLDLEREEAVRAREVQEDIENIISKMR